MVILLLTLFLLYYSLCIVKNNNFYSDKEKTPLNAGFFLDPLDYM